MKHKYRLAELPDLARLFLKLGTTAFGGPAAHIAMMEGEVVRKRAWLSREEFLDLIGATNLIPGPNSTEMAIHIGRQRAGFLGLVVAGACFILPAAAIVTLFAWAYVRFGKLPEVGWLLYGIKPVVIAIVGQAFWNLTRSAVKSRWLLGLGIVAAISSLIGANELVVLIGAGTLAAVTTWSANHVRRNGPPLLLSISPFGLGPLFLVFLKVGAVLFGSGYVLLAFLRTDLVQHYGWLTESTLLDAIAVGQFTPGPVFTTATFIGYVLAGIPGATVATLGIFLPSFVYVGVTGALIPRIRRSAIAGAFLDGVNIGAVSLLLIVGLQLGHAAIVDVLTMLVALTSLVLLVRFRVNATWLIIGGAVLGMIAKLAF